MADISRITLPNGGSYDLKDAVRGVEYIVGTQTGATGSWTGITTRAALFDGMMIRYYLPYAGSGNASLNLTLSGGGETGNKPVYYNNKTRVKTHFPANSVIDLTYSTKIESTGAWCAGTQYNSNTYTTAMCETAGNVAAKVATCTNFSLYEGCALPIIFKYANTVTSNTTLNVNGTGARPLFVNAGSTSSNYGAFPAGSYLIYYSSADSGTWRLRSDGFMPISISGSSLTAGTAYGLADTLSVSGGGTGVTTLASGEALIGNGAGAITTRGIRNNTLNDSIGWTTNADSINLLTQNDIAYWNGAYSNTSSNLKYTSVGELKNAATYEIETTLANDNKLPTGAAVTAAINALGLSGFKVLNITNGTSTTSVLQDVVNNAGTLSNNTVFIGTHTKNGVRAYIAYLYTAKNYGACIYFDYAGTCQLQYLNDGTYSNKAL